MSQIFPFLVFWLIVLEVPFSFDLKYTDTLVLDLIVNGVD